MNLQGKMFSIILIILHVALKCGIYLGFIVISHDVADNSSSAGFIILVQQGGEPVFSPLSCNLVRSPSGQVVVPESSQKNEKK